MDSNKNLLAPPPKPKNPALKQPLPKLPFPKLNGKSSKPKPISKPPSKPTPNKPAPRNILPSPPPPTPKRLPAKNPTYVPPNNPHINKELPSNNKSINRGNVYIEKKCCPDLWKELHIRALRFDKSKQKDDHEFLKIWADKIPKGSCKCQDSWESWIKICPPDFTSRDSYFAWTVKSHNMVNMKLYKRIWSVAEAKKKWLPLI